ncbi:MAG: MBL fold metallo-hydrolase [Candidatus Paceibacterota bacterium]
MKISFHGAAREVTGSCILIETGKTRFLVDCGMFQGEDDYKRNSSAFSFDPRSIDFVLLTHAHVDHCGRLPKLYRDGFRGRVFTTKPTADLAKLMMLDSAKIFLFEQARRGQEPIYYDYDVEGVSELFSFLEYEKEQAIIAGIKVRPKNSGHILGSAIFEVSINDNGVEKKIIFSGDLGNSPSAIIRDREYILGGDIVFIESTYGNRVHKSKEAGRKELKAVIEGVVARNSILIIPVFALERVQELLYELNNWVEKGELPVIPVFLDSPLAISATAVYQRYPDYFNEETKQRIKKGDSPFSFEGLKFTSLSQDSKKVNKTKPPKIILAGGGMGEGGRIGNYFEKYISGTQNEILIISYQADGTIGRKLLDGEKEINIGKNKVKVRAKISSIFSFSSHADEPALLDWALNIKSPKPKMFFVIHGDEEASQSLAQALKEKSGIAFTIPKINKEYEI